MVKKKKENPWKDWHDYEDKNFLTELLKDIADIGMEEAAAKHKLESWFKSKIAEHMLRVVEGEDVKDL